MDGQPGGLGPPRPGSLKRPGTCLQRRPVSKGMENSGDGPLSDISGVPKVRASTSYSDPATRISRGCTENDTISPDLR